MTYSTEAANNLISTYAKRKNIKSELNDYDTNWNSMFNVLISIGMDNNWESARTLHLMVKKYNEKGNSAVLTDVHRGVFSYLVENNPGVMTAAQVYTNNMDIAAYLGLTFKKGGKNDEFIGYEIKSSQSLRFHKDWNWIMGVAEIIRTTHEVSFSGTSCMIREHGENTEPILTIIEQGEDTLTMAYRAIVAHARNFKMQVPTTIDNSELPEENTEDIDVDKAEAIDPTPVEVKVDDLDVPYSDTSSNIDVDAVTEGVIMDEDEDDEGIISDNNEDDDLSEVYSEADDDDFIVD
ncbi:MAG: hypothetical protein P8P29_00030 [Flavobacteriaceae bacterium]|nr:hypothetical protein [Flavobacteriaceae bacterium]